MKVVKIGDALLKQLEEMDSFLRKIERKNMKKRNTLNKNIGSVRKQIFEIKKLHQESSPMELSILTDLLITMNDILRQLIINKYTFKDYTIALNKFSKLVDKCMKEAYYDFFRLCGNCASCCTSPHVFSFEHDFIDKYRKYLKRKGRSYEVKNNPKTKLCSLYDTKTKKCTVYHERPLDCTFFPFSFIIQNIARKGVKPRKYILLCKATECDVADRLSLNDALEALEMICFILSKISLDEALQYSQEADPRKMLFDLSIPYDEKKHYYKALRQIFHNKFYFKKT